MKNFMKFTLIFVSLLLWSTASYSQTAVYMDANNGAYGYCYGNYDVSACAFNNCIKYGGENPHSVLKVNSKGYGAIALGKDMLGNRILGAAAGYQTLSEAKEVARRACINSGAMRNTVYIEDTFLDN